MSIHATLRHYAWVIRHRCAFILLGITICTSVTYVVGMYLPPLYQATCILKVSATAMPDGDTLAHAQMLATNYTPLVTSPQVLQATAQKFPGLTVNQLQSMVTSSSIGTSQLISISVQATTATRAAQIANTAGNTFIQIQESRESAQLQTTLQQLSPLITTTRLKLDATQRQLGILQKEQGSGQAISQQQSLIDTYHNSYNQLLTHYSQLQIQKIHVPTLLSITQPATAPLQPIGPPLWLLSVVVAGLSCSLLICWVLVRDWLDASLKTVDDVIRGCGLAVLGQLPQTNNLKKSARLLDFSLHKLEPLRTAFAVVGMNLQVLYKGQPTLLCTGLNHRSGTSLVASQLALTLAHSGARVLLIDTNLQHPSQHIIFNLPNTQGLLNHLAEMQPITTNPAAWLAQWKTYVPNLWLLPTGITAAHSQSQISIPALTQLQQCLQGKNASGGHADATGLIDVIIFDTAPLEEGSLTQSLAAVADTSVLVIQARQTQPEQLNKAAKLLEQLQAPILGVVVNKRKARHYPYFYHQPHALTHGSDRHALVTPLTTQSVSQASCITEISPQVELPETPQPWQSRELLKPSTPVAIQSSLPAKLSLPSMRTSAPQRFTSLIPKTNSTPVHPETAAGQPENENEIYTAPELPIASSLPQQILAETTEKKNTPQFRRPDFWDGTTIESREQLT
ncbi:cellulose synthase operon protein YhjQ/BcsQ [Dictyobacter kobayashii]|uniref:Polysaccharide chain length determinant N-terminal domain-containing protein n=1 Tax=Dictyobacter kobayashii TaxID=2014872 RepID=A0A402AHD1_9CHLR|nr:cellulose synthase operon protein YhjQ/BcsQ [Dictyobacter kobayashii]GCE18520.1 hypothetical protein KDK_23200 [Dictyobacter kobayashii]